MDQIPLRKTSRNADCENFSVPKKDLRQFLTGLPSGDLSTFIVDLAANRPSIRRALESKINVGKSPTKGTLSSKNSIGKKSGPIGDNRVNSLWSLSYQNLNSTDALFNINTIQESINDLDNPHPTSYNSIHNLADAEKTDLQALEQVLKSGKNMNSTELEKFDIQFGPAFSLLRNSMLIEMEAQDRKAKRLEEKIQTSENALKMRDIQLMEYEQELEVGKHKMASLEVKNAELREYFEQKLNSMTQKRNLKPSGEKNPKLAKVDGLVKQLRLKIDHLKDISKNTAEIKGQMMQLKARILSLRRELSDVKAENLTQGAKLVETLKKKEELVASLNQLMEENNSLKVLYKQEQQLTQELRESFESESSDKTRSMQNLETEMRENDRLNMIMEKLNTEKNEISSALKVSKEELARYKAFVEKLAKREEAYQANDKKQADKLKNLEEELIKQTQKTEEAMKRFEMFKEELDQKKKNVAAGQTQTEKSKSAKLDQNGAYFTFLKTQPIKKAKSAKVEDNGAYYTLFKIPEEEMKPVEIPREVVIEEPKKEILREEKAEQTEPLQMNEVENKVERKRNIDLMRKQQKMEFKIKKQQKLQAEYERLFFDHYRDENVMTCRKRVKLSTFSRL